MTIGERLGKPGASLTEVLKKISDGEFNMRYLGRFPVTHQLALQDCCLRAIEDLAGDPFEGRASFARLMGRAMELLRERHGIDAPRGWYPVMKALRGAPTA